MELPETDGAAAAPDPVTGPGEELGRGYVRGLGRLCAAVLVAGLLLEEAGPGVEASSRGACLP